MTAAKRIKAAADPCPDYLLVAGEAIAEPMVRMFVQLHELGLRAGELAGRVDTDPAVLPALAEVLVVCTEVTRLARDLPERFVPDGHGHPAALLFRTVVEAILNTGEAASAVDSVLIDRIYAAAAR